MNIKVKFISKLTKTIQFAVLAFVDLLVKFTFMFIFLKYLIDIVVYLLN